MSWKFQALTVDLKSDIWQLGCGWVALFDHYMNFKCIGQCVSFEQAFYNSIVHIVSMHIFGAV